MDDTTSRYAHLLCNFRNISETAPIEIFHTIFFSGVTCPSEEPLLNGINPVPDSYFTASSIYGASYAAYKAHLDGGGGFWVASSAEKDAIPPTFFLQVN